MKVTIIGLGLIGGSIGLRMKNSGLATAVIGIDKNAENSQKAIELGLVLTKCRAYQKELMLRMLS